MDKKAVVYTHNGILHGHEKECIWISSNEVDETGAYYTEWSESERKTPIEYIKAYIYGIYKDGNNDPICETARDTDVKNKLLDSVGEGERGMLWE